MIALILGFAKLKNWAQRRRLATIPAVLLTLLVLCPLAFAAQWFEGDTICYENQYGKVCQNPHTLTDFTNFVEVNATSYFSVSQDLDFAFGFDTLVAVPKKAWRWSENAAHQVPTYGDVSRSLQCLTGAFNYTIEPKYAWCYDSTSNQTPVWEHHWENAWLSNKTIEWFEWGVNGSQTAYWPDWVELTQFSTAYYAGKKWFVLTASFEPNETKRLRAKIDVQPWTRGKYDVAIKRSSDSWSEAFASGHVAVLDPWWDAAWAYRQPFTLTSYDGKDLTLVPIILNATGLTLANNNCSQEMRVTLTASTEVETQFAVLNDSGQTEAAGSQWCLLHVLINATTAVPNATHAQLNTTTGYVYYNNAAAAADHTTNIRGGTVQVNMWATPSEEAVAYNWTTQPAYGGTGTNYGALQAIGNNEVMYFEAASGGADNRWMWMRPTAGTSTVTLVTRYKSVNSSLFNPSTRIFSGALATNWEVNATHVIVKYANGSECAAVAVASANTAYHEYWMAFNGATGNTKLYVDGVLTVDAACVSASADDRIEFGSANTPVIGAGYWDFVWFSNGTILLPLNYSFSAQEDQAFFEFNITSTTYSPSVYETNESLFNITIEYNTSVISSFQAVKLVYNGSEYNTSKTDNGSTAYFNRTHTTPFLSGSNVNNTGLPFYWSVHGNYSNGTDFIVNTSSLTQFVWFAWFWNAWTVSPTTLLWGWQALATLNTTRLFGTATLSAQIDWSATNYSLTVDGFNFTRVNTAPGYSTTFGVVGWLKVSFDGSSRLNMTNNVSVTVVAASIVACNATANQTILNFSARNEESNVSVNFTMDATFWLWDPSRTVNATYSSNWTNVDYVELCIYPNWASGQVDSFQQYYFNGYYPRNYFLDHADVSNVTTQNVSLILANNTLTKNTLFTLKDANGLLLGGRTIVVQRYYAATNSFETIAMMKTDSNGYGLTYSTVNDVFYIYSIVLNGKVIEIITPSAPISCSPALSQCTKELQLSTVLIGEYYLTAGQIAGNCSWSPSTNLTVCIVSDGSGLSRSWRLTVTKLGLAANTVVCVATLNSSAGVLTCPVTDDGEYSASLVALGSFSVVESFTFVKGALTSLFGLDFVFLSLLVILSIGFAAIGSPAAGVFFLSIGVAFAKLLGLLVISVGATIMVVALGILIAWKLRT